jgi:DNA-binding transcriptional regulator of glucitol operon
MTLVLSMLGAISLGMVVQMFLTYKQTKAFSGAVRELKQHGTVSVGGGGKRYRGGRAFVAIAADPAGRVTRAVTLTGWTTFARPSRLSSAEGMRLGQLRRESPIPTIRPRERAALQQAAQTLHAHLVTAA